jgi:hypothetical protein
MAAGVVFPVRMRPSFVPGSTPSAFAAIRLITRTISAVSAQRLGRRFGSKLTVAPVSRAT